MNINIKNTLFILIITGLLSGCSFFNLGKPMGSCEENGCDYSDAGICGDLFDNYKARYDNLDLSYKNIDCSKCNKGN